MEKIIAIFMSAIMTASVSMSAFASFEAEQLEQSERATFIVELESDAVVSTQAATRAGTDYINSYEGERKEAQILSEQKTVIQSISEREENVELGYTYTTLFNGFSIDAPIDAIDKIKSVAGVKNVYKARLMYPSLASAVEQTYSLPAQTSDGDVLGYTGEGQVVAVLDSEFQLDHEFFKTAPKNPKITKADLDGIDGLERGTYISEKIPFAHDYESNDATTMDIANAHGTHVAGIVAGKNGTYPYDSTSEDGTALETFSGVAPEAQLVLMKVGVSQGEYAGSISEDYVIAAMQDVVKLGVCAVNMSFGMSYSSVNTRGGYEQSITKAVDLGITVNVAASNSGIGYNSSDISVENSDYFTAGSPATYSSVTAVASAVNGKKIYTVGTLTLSDATEIEYREAFVASGFAGGFAGREIAYVDCGYGRTEDFSGKDVTGKLALIRRGSISYTQKSNNAKAAGAVGVILYEFPSDDLNTVALSLPTIIISTANAQKLIAVENKSVTVGGLKNVQRTHASGGEISDFSSWGVTESLELKPEITAPGGNIFSSVPSNNTNAAYKVMSGTSMAAPHMIGVTALMSEYIERNNVDVSGVEKVLRIENMLMSAADIIYQPESDVPYSPRVQGAGMVNTANAMKSPVIIIGDGGKTKLNLKEVDNTLELNFTLKNLTGKEEEYDVSFDVITDDYDEGTSGNVFTGKSRALAYTDSTIPESITVPANGEYSLSAVITLDKAVLDANKEIFKNGFFIDGFVKFTSSDKPQISIPFTGFYDDWTAMSVFDKTMYDSGGSLLYGSWERQLPGTYVWTDRKVSGVKKLLICGTSTGYYNKNRIAISPNKDGMADELGIDLTLMRPTRDIELKLTNNSDPTKQTAQSYAEPVAKYLPTRLELETIGALSERDLPDGKYTLTTSGTFCYDGAEADAFELPVIIDRKKPKITKVSIADDTLTVYAHDENYIDYIYIWYKDANGATKTLSAAMKGAANAVVSASCSIAGINADSIVVGAEDCAMNTTEVTLENGIGTMVAALTDYTTLSGMTSATVDLANSGTELLAGTAIMAFYDNYGRYITATTKAISLDASKSDTFTFKLLEDTTLAKEIRLFIWNNLNAVVPLDTLKAFSIN